MKRVRIIYVFLAHADGNNFADPNRRNTFTGDQPGARAGYGRRDARVGGDRRRKAAPEDLVLRKYRPDAFYGTILDSVLRWNGVKTIVFVGLGVAVGGVPTLSTASNLGYFPWRSRMH